MDKSDLNEIISLRKIIFILSGFVFFSNLFGVIVFKMIMPETNTLTYPLDGISFFWNHFIIFSLVLSLIALISIISSIFLLNLKNWSRVILIITSSVIIMSNVALSVFIIKGLYQESKNWIISAVVLIVILIFTTPFIFFITTLTKKKIKELFFKVN